MRPRRRVQNCTVGIPTVVHVDDARPRGAPAGGIVTSRRDVMATQDTALELRFFGRVEARKVYTIVGRWGTNDIFEIYSEMVSRGVTQHDNFWRGRVSKPEFPSLFPREGGQTTPKLFPGPHLTEKPELLRRRGQRRPAVFV
jgi:hypothetical protein